MEIPGQMQINVNANVRNEPAAQPGNAQQVNMGGAVPVRQLEHGRAVEAHLLELLNVQDRRLSDDELLAEIQRNSEEMDKNINDRLLDMRSRQADIRGLMAANDAISAQANRAGNAAVPLDLAAPVSYQNADGTTARSTLGEILRANGVNVGSVTTAPESLRTIRDAISHKADSIKTDNERGQMDVQQMMSRRSQLFQMTSNVLASRNETRKSIAQNIR
jgi:hypothetical protein